MKTDGSYGKRAVPAAPQKAGLEKAVKTELEKAVTRVEEERNGRWAQDINRREERASRAVGGVTPRSRSYAALREVIAATRENLPRLPSIGTLRSPSSIIPPYSTAFYGATERPVPNRQQILADYPWSAYGRGIVRRTPFLTEGTAGALAVPSAIRTRATTLGATQGTKLALPDILRGLPWPESIYVKTGGVTVPHELSHVAQTGTWSRADEEGFGNDLLTWLNRKPMAEWGEDRKYIYAQYVRRGKSMVEAYAHLGERPEVIPPELEHWFPQYDLTRRRAMGVPYRPGYAGPPVSARFPLAPLSKGPK